MGRAYQSRGPVIITPTLKGEKVIELLIGVGRHAESPEQTYQNFTTKGPLAHMFERAKIVHKTGCGVTAFTSMKVPYRGNVLAIGDAAAYVEVETQGALMCGFHAGNAVAKELAGDRGFVEYTGWWQDTFEFNGDEALKVAQGYALVPTYTDDELDYLFALIEGEVLEGTGSQYKSPTLMWDAILKHSRKIAQERPEIDAKIKRNWELTLKGTF